jgi:hypothetical protein
MDLPQSFGEEMDIATVLVEKYNGSKWNLVDNDYDQLSWEDDNEISKPSLDELEQKWQEFLAEIPMKRVREQRNFLLKKTDMYGLTDFSFKTEEEKQAWTEYRQALRDLPTNTEDPENPIWPTPPS